jgi:hypothetical protein
VVTSGADHVSICLPIGRVVNTRCNRSHRQYRSNVDVVVACLDGTDAAAGRRVPEVRRVSGEGPGSCSTIMFVVEFLFGFLWVAASVAVSPPSALSPYVQQGRGMASIVDVHVPQRGVGDDDRVNSGGAYERRRR